MDAVVVSVVDERRLPEVVAALREAGMVVDDVLSALGMVTGSIDPEALGSLRAVPGVSHVERQRGFQLPPPTSPT
jgi:hypothetical protein